MNFLTGLLLLLILFAPAAGFYQEVYGGPMEGYGVEDCGLLPGDRLLAVDGHRVLVNGNARFFLSRAGETVDFVVERDGERVELKGVYLPYQERTDAEGNYTRLRGLTISQVAAPAGLLDKLAYTWNSALDMVRTVWISLGDLVTGAVGLRDLSGPVGIVDMMSDVGSQSATAWDTSVSSMPKRISGLSDPNRSMASFQVIRGRGRDSSTPQIWPNSSFNRRSFTSSTSSTSTKDSSISIWVNSG